MTPARYASGCHISVAREVGQDPIDSALALRDLRRRVSVSLVAGFSTALALARASDLIASVPERHTGTLRIGLHRFPLPIPVPEFTVSLLWHPRLDADPGHRWLRTLVREICTATG
jgi:DNA-binding transcriptional LysR family regulator